MITPKSAIIIEVAENLLLVLLGISMFCLPSGTLRIIVLVCFVVFAAFSCLEGVSRIVANNDRQKKLILANKELESSFLAKLDIANREIVQPDKCPLVPPPALSADDMAGNTERIKDLISSLFEDKVLPNSYKGYFRNIQSLLTADKYLTKFQETLSRPLIDELRHTDLPLTDENYKLILRHLFQFALIMLDYTDTYRFNINNNEEQLNSVRVAAGEMPIARAWEESKEVTDLPDVTPGYIRVLKSMLDKLNIGDEPLLFSGYKL